MSVCYGAAGTEPGLTATILFIKWGIPSADGIRYGLADLCFVVVFFVVFFFRQTFWTFSGQFL